MREYPEETPNNPRNRTIPEGRNYAFNTLALRISLLRCFITFGVCSVLFYHLWKRRVKYQNVMLQACYKRCFPPYSAHDNCFMYKLLRKMYICGKVLSSIKM